MRRALTTCVMLAASAVFPAAAGAAGDGAVPAGDGAAWAARVPGAMSADGGASLLRDLRRLRDGTLPDEGMLLGDPAPTPLAPGVASTLATVDVDGDGVAELVQVRGTAINPRLAVTNGADGSQRWSKAMSTYAFSVRVVPDGDGAADLLTFASGTIELLDGATGMRRWQRTAGSSGYWGLSPTPDGGDIVLGSYTQTPFWQLRLEFRSLATGAARGSITVEAIASEADFPTAALAGDLDGDGIGDVFTFTPNQLLGSASAGALTAWTGRGGAQEWTTTFAIPKHDFSYLIAGIDATGDGVRDPVILSEWIGAFGVDPANDSLTIVDGRGGDLAGVQPAMQHRLEHWPYAMVTPGDLNGDGREDIVLSGPVYNFGDGQVKVVFEALSGTGRLWKASPGYATAYEDVGYGWWPLAGDLDGDGGEDALVLLGDGSGPHVGAGVSMRTGAELWRRDGLAGGYMAPTWADGSGDGADDVLDDWTVTHPDPTLTRFAFAVRSGKDLAPMWSHGRTVDSGGTMWSVGVSGGHIDPAGDEDIVMDYNLGGSGRHVSESLRGADGAVKWVDPAA